MMTNSLENILPELSPDLQKVIIEYWELASLSELSDKQEDQFARILERATESELLTFWIAEIDHIIGHKLGFLNPEDRESYQNQQALLREYLAADSDLKSENACTENFFKHNGKNQRSSLSYPPNCRY